MKNEYPKRVDYECVNGELKTKCPHKNKCKNRIIDVASDECISCDEFVSESIDDAYIICSEVFYSPALLTDKV